MRGVEKMRKRKRTIAILTRKRWTWRYPMVRPALSLRTIPPTQLSRIHFGVKTSMGSVFSPLKRAGVSWRTSGGIIMRGERRTPFPLFLHPP